MTEVPGDVVSHRAGDRLEDLYRQHARALFRLALVLTGDASLAEDLLQETFLRFHRSHAAPAAGSELAYLRRTIINLSHGHHRHLRVVRRTASEEPRTGMSAETEAVDADRRRLVAAAVRALAARQRDCVVLHYFDELTDTEIAASLGISAGSVKTHLHRGRAALAEQLEDLR